MTQECGNKFLYGVAFFCLFLLFLPKINLVNFESETAGIRVDDIILALFSFFLGLAFFFNNRKFTPIEIGLFFIIAASFFSYLINTLLVLSGILEIKAKLFYVFRILEYFLFFYIGQMAACFISLRRVVQGFILFNLAFMILQKMGIVGRITEMGTQSIDIYRISGVASFPSEMGGLLNMIFAYLLFEGKSDRKFLLFLFFFALITLTGARIALAGIVFIYGLYLIRKKKINWQRTIIWGFPLLLTIIFVGGGLIANTESLYTRSLKLFSVNNLQIVTRTWEAVDIKKELYDNILLTPGDYDMSWWIRLHKWCYALKMYVLHPECYLQGVGPGVFSAALDGGVIRILTENGIMGCLLYGSFFKILSKQSEALKWVILSFLINMLFFDIYLAYKTMSFLFLAAGYAVWQRNVRYA